MESSNNININCIGKCSNSPLHPLSLRVSRDENMVCPIHPINKANKILQFKTCEQDCYYDNSQYLTPMFLFNENRRELF